MCSSNGNGCNTNSCDKVTIAIFNCYIAFYCELLFLLHRIVEIKYNINSATKEFEFETRFVGLLHCKMYKCFSCTEGDGYQRTKTNNDWFASVSTRSSFVAAAILLLLEFCLLYMLLSYYFNHTRTKCTKENEWVAERTLKQFYYPMHLFIS